MLQFAFIIEGVEAKAKTRWYYNRFPKPVVKGFTLAEVLLVLTIIDLVAFFTIPPLENSVVQSQYNTGVWQAYTMLSQAVEELQANNGYIHIGTDASIYSAGLIRTDFCSVLSCVRTDTEANIYSSISNPFYYSYYKGSFFTLNNRAISTYPMAILNNGMYVTFSSNGSCTGNFGVNACAVLDVDINGAAGPNMLGEDYYTFYLVLNNGIYSILPAGSPGDTVSTPGNNGNCAIGSYAQGCTYQRLYNPNNMP